MIQNGDGDSYQVGRGGGGVTPAWSPLGNFIEGQAHPNVLLLLCFSHVILHMGLEYFALLFNLYKIGLAVNTEHSHWFVMFNII